MKQFLMTSCYTQSESGASPGTSLVMCTSWLDSFPVDLQDVLSQSKPSFLCSVLMFVIQTGLLGSVPFPL